MKNKTRLKAEALESATGLVPVIVGMVTAEITIDATAQLGIGASFLLALIASMAVCCGGFVAMRAAYLPTLTALKAAADQETAAGR